MPDRGEARRAWIRALEAVCVLEQAPVPTLASMLGGLAREGGDRPALLGDAGRLSYWQLAAQSDRIARWARAHGLAGATVGLLMPNRPEYVAIWLGLSRAGVVVALLNTNLTGDGLLHGIRVAGITRLVVDDALLPAMAAVGERLPAATRVQPWSALHSELERHSGAPLNADELPLPKSGDPALLIYTSGTTGHPKAAKLTHARLLEWSLWFAGMLDVQADDRLYDCLPLYHSTGGIVAIGAMLVRGGSVRIASGFSASRFWDDVVDGGCTIFLYIGELCRYLARSPAHPNERQHRLRLACGNGLQANVWTEFERRFAIPQILEFYAATEGNVSLYNCEGKPGAIGRIPPFLARRFPLALIRVDADDAAPLRDSAGFCIPCGPGECGEAIGSVDPDSRSPARQFSGYTDPDASVGKVLRNVFTGGDCWFRTGDLMRRDEAGYFYFVDRLGDNFRWKGENVATTEVAAAVRACPGVVDAVVYGVEVPGQEGRAGMTAFTTDDRFEFTTLAAHLAMRLPGYAQPLFARTCRALETTGTFKLATAKLAREGYAGLNDPVWFHDRAQGRFIPCDDALLASIRDGTIRT